MRKQEDDQQGEQATAEIDKAEMEALLRKIIGPNCECKVINAEVDPAISDGGPSVFRVKVRIAKSQPDSADDEI